MTGREDNNFCLHFFKGWLYLCSLNLHLYCLPVGCRTTHIISRASHIGILVPALVGGRLGHGIGSIALFWPEMRVIKAEYEGGSKD